MVKMEFKIVRMDRPPKDFEHELNVAGSEGYEVVGVGQSSYAFVTIMSRPAEPPE